MSNQSRLQNSCKCSEVTALPVSSEYKRWRTPTQPPVTCQPSWHQEVQWICRTQTGSRQCLQTLLFPPARLHPCPLLPPPPPHLPPASTFPSKTSSGQTSPSSKRLSKINLVVAEKFPGGGWRRALLVFSFFLTIGMVPPCRALDPFVPPAIDGFPRDRRKIHGTKHGQYLTVYD